MMTQELRGLRKISRQHQPEQVEILSQTTVEDGHGGWTTDWLTVDTVPGRIRASGSTAVERFMAVQLQLVQSWMVAVPAETVITDQQRLKVGARTFTIKAILEPRSYEVETRVMATEL